MNGRLGRDQCLELLASAPVGRIVYTERALPAVVPVTFVLDGDVVTVPAMADSALGAALRGTVVAFQADAVDPLTMTGWWVTVIGLAQYGFLPGRAGRSLRIPVRDARGTRIG